MKRSPRAGGSSPPIRPNTSYPNSTRSGRPSSSTGSGSHVPLQDEFQPDISRPAREGEIYRYAFGDYRVFYRSAGVDNIEGLAVDEQWVRESLRPQVDREIGGVDTARQETVVYGGAIALVLLVLSAGIALQVRDASREAHTSRLRADFVSDVSHELKTPITLIRLYGDTLLDALNCRPRSGTSFIASSCGKASV